MTSLTVKSLTIEYPMQRRGLGGIGFARRLHNRRFVEKGHGTLAVRALDDVSFSLTGGDRLAVIGPNGAGKSTLLMSMAGLLTPVRGEVNAVGHVEALFRPRLGFRPEASGRRNIYLRGLMRQWNTEQIERATEDIIEFSELGEFIDMPLRSYSDGMSARLAFAISTAFAPDILLMDEWIGAGDQAFQVKAVRRMDEFLSNVGIIVLASHNESLLKRVCNKAVVIENGKVTRSGAIHELIE